MRKQWIPGRIFYFERPGYEAIATPVLQKHQVVNLICNHHKETLPDPLLSPTGNSNCLEGQNIEQLLFQKIFNQQMFVLRVKILTF